jgi:hypothetical protein
MFGYEFFMSSASGVTLGLMPHTSEARVGLAGLIPK